MPPSDPADCSPYYKTSATSSHCSDDAGFRTSTPVIDSQFRDPKPAEQKKYISMKSANAVARAFKALHVPSSPLRLANVHDATSARIVAALPGCAALASASFSVARAVGISDAALSHDLDTHLRALGPIAAVAREAGLPFSVDLQGGYGARLEEAVLGVVRMGAVGINLEDSVEEEQAAAGGEGTTSVAVVMDETVAVERIRRALAVAASEGLPEFVVNARPDSHLAGGTLEESIRRGRLYLDAGATTVYILSQMPGGFTESEVTRMVTALDGKVNIGVRLPGLPLEGSVKPLTSDDLARLGVARISVGPQLYFAAERAMKEATNSVF
ncbi:hypothetical protein VTK73DRAFT_3369 [Phialemonium thermophilum]|uniref:Uncharacterized protein n=1 Tax=Phialemonium thermophilum TaxID=223376 RepID=A0ABR3WZH0_9PEZI